MIRTPQITLLTLFCIGLSACGGGSANTSGGTNPGAQQPPGLFDTENTGTSDIAAMVMENGAATVSVETGSLNRMMNKMLLGALSGDVSADRTELGLATGGMATISPGDTEFVAALTVTQTGADPQFGVIGIPTNLSELPTATTTYSGRSDINVTDGTGVYELSGAMTASADFASGTVDLDVSSLGGTRLTGTASDPVSNVGSVSIDNAMIAGNGFSGGEMEVNSSVFSGTLTGGHTFANQGGFFGPGGTEIGGTFVAEDTDIRIEGTIIGR